MFWIYQGPAGVAAPTPGQWQMVGQVCLRAGQFVGREVPAFTLQEFQRLPIPASRIRVQPATRRTLVNVETNVYADSHPVIIRTTLLGLPVRVRAIPVKFTWSFGDGTSLRTRDAGAPYPRMTTAHVYRQPGRRAISLVTSYAGEFSVSDGPWLPVDGEVEVSSATVVVVVHEARAHLVDGLQI
jgi:hypothetical protein